MTARQRRQVRTPAHRHVGCNTLQAFVPVLGAGKRAALDPNNANVCVCDMYKFSDNGNNALVLPPVLPRYEALDSPVRPSPPVRTAWLKLENFRTWRACMAVYMVLEQ